MKRLPCWPCLKLQVQDLIGSDQIQPVPSSIDQTLCLGSLNCFTKLKVAALSNQGNFSKKFCTWLIMMKLALEIPSHEKIPRQTSFLFNNGKDSTVHDWSITSHHWHVCIHKPNSPIHERMTDHQLPMYISCTIQSRLGSESHLSEASNLW